MKYKTSKYLIYSDILDDSKRETQRIIYSTRSGDAIVVPDRICKDIKINNYEILPPSILQQLFRSEILVPEHDNEFETILAQNIEAEKDDKTLAFVIQPTANCQLGCHYCGQSHKKHTLTDDLIPRILQRVAELSQEKAFDSMYITWFGGEPLLGYNQIKKISKEFIKLCDHKTWHYSSKIVTNAVSLKQNIALQLITDCKVTYFQITIDGTKDFHDKRRVTKKGSNGTFDIILSNIINLLDLDSFQESKCFLEIRMNIDKTNYESIPDLIDLLASYKIYEKNVGLTFAPILDWGGNEASSESLDNDLYGELEIEWFIHAYSKGFKPGNIIPARRHAPCMVVNKSSEVLDAYGNIYPCYELPITPAYNKPEYKIGNLKFPKQTYNNEAVPRNWFRDIKENISWCPDCTYFPVCGGGCPKEWYNKKPACPPFKFNGGDRIILQHILDNTNNLSELI